MNPLNNKATIFLVAAIPTLLATVLFFVMPITPTTAIAYAFTLLAIVMLVGGNLYLLASPKSYPWFAAFPITILRYLVLQFVLSAVFVLREVIFAGAFPVGLFVVLHIVLLGVCAVLLTLMHGGKEIIEKRDDEVKQKVNALRTMQADVESILRKKPEHEKPLRSVAEALKYSDPMSHASVVCIEEQIQRGISSMAGLCCGNEQDISVKIHELCNELLCLIADRNSSVKAKKAK